MTKLKAKINKSHCIGCGACAASCPSGAISIGKDGKAEVNEKKCVGCGECVSACPVAAIDVK